LYILIGILLLFIASIVAAYFGARTWHWAHVVLVVAIFLATAGFLILSAEVLRVNAVQRAQVNKLQKDLDQVLAKNAALAKGSRDPKIIGQLTGEEVKIPEGADEMPSVDDLEHNLSLIERDRGRVWRNVMPAGVDAKTDTVKVIVGSPPPPPPAGQEPPAEGEAPKPAAAAAPAGPIGIVKDSIVFLFEQGDPASPDPTKGPQYLGEFRVTAVADKQVTMVAVQLLDDFELKRLQSSKGPWVLHDTMPVDQYKLFEGLTEEQLRKWLPEKSVKEYLRHGTAKEADDEPIRVVGLDEEGKPVDPKDMSKAVKILYQRRLRDYSVEFDELARDRVVLLANIAGVTKDNERLKAALVSAKQLQAFREDELQKLHVDLAGITKERAAIEKHLAQVQQQLTDDRQELARLLDENARLAEQLARLEGQRTISPARKSSSATQVAPLALSTEK
jgi:uncharacterized membrane-anchored protein YhcB (DUF1043 family)